MSSASSSSSFLRSPLFSAVAGASAAVVGGLAVGSYLTKKSNRKNPKLTYTLEQQIQALKEIYPRLCQEFIDDVKNEYNFPQFALDRLKRVRQSTHALHIFAMGNTIGLLID